MMDNSPEEIFKAMNVSRILVSILKKIEKISITTDEFLSANADDVELSVDYNDETLSFEFKLRQKDNG
jgi:hypothetical protein